jgi:predicted dehydrogenase
MATNRRNFLKKAAKAAAAGTLLAGINTRLEADNIHIAESFFKPVAAADKIRIALIGCGIIGHFDTKTALRVPGTELVAVCDLYDDRLVRAKEVWGSQITTTRDYREILLRKDVDAVLICVPDHWHDRISIDALNAGKHVYCEKPMVHHVEEGAAVIAAHKKSGKVFQVGSQRASAISVLKANEYVKKGLIGEINYAEACVDRSDALGAWNYTMPFEINPSSIDWDRFLGDAPKRSFDATHFFRWRNFKEYGTGVAGDLFVHLITGLHTITGALGPKRIFAVGDLNYWKDGRNAMDLVTAILDYPKTDKHASFPFFTRVNLADGSGGLLQTRVVGTEGVIEIGWNDVTLKTLKRPNAPMYSEFYDSLFTFSEAEQAKFRKTYQEKYPESQFTNEVKYAEAIKVMPPEGYDDRFDHMVVFFNAIRGEGKVLEDAEFGFRAAAPSLLCNLSAERKAPVNWDPVGMKVLK